MNCLCCSEKLLPHIKGNGLSWYCLSCRQIMCDATDHTLISYMKHHQSIQY